MSKNYVGEVGTQILLDCGVLLGSITEKHIRYRKPDGVTIGSFDATLYSSYSQLAEATGTYFIVHSTVASDFDVPGEWRLQAFLAAVNGTWLGETAKVNIFGAFE